MTGTRWEAIDPEQPCTDPDGHRMLEERDLSDPAPRISCVTCRAETTVFVIPTEPDDGHEHEWLSLTSYADMAAGNDRELCPLCNTERLVPREEQP